MRRLGHRRRGHPIDPVLTWEAGPRRNADWCPAKAAVVAHWSIDGSLSRSVLALTRELTRSGHEVVLVSSASAPQTGVDPVVLGEGVTLFRRPNSGYDFGTWHSALSHFQGLRAAQQVVLANDSMAGPFASLEPILARMAKSSAQVWSLTASQQMTWHPQSYFVCYRDSVLADEPLRRFWDGVQAHEDKSAVIHNYELGLGRLLRAQRYRVDVAFPSADLLVGRRKNPTIRGWRALLDAGLPMVKRQLLTDPTVAADAVEIPGEIKRRYSEDVFDWM